MNHPIDFYGINIDECIGMSQKSLQNVLGMRSKLFNKLKLKYALPGYVMQDNNHTIAFITSKELIKIWMEKEAPGSVLSKMHFDEKLYDTQAKYYANKYNVKHVGKNLLSIEITEEEGGNTEMINEENITGRDLRDIIKETGAKDKIVHPIRRDPISTQQLNKMKAEKSGNLKSFNLNLPYEMKDVSEMSKHTQKEYFENILKKYPGIDSFTIGQMLQIGASKAKTLVEDLGLKFENSATAEAADSRVKFKKEMLDLLTAIKAGKQEKYLQDHPEVNIPIDLSGIMIKAHLLQTLTYAQFKTLPSNERKAYIEGLISKYNVNGITIFKMFEKDCAKNYFYAQLRKDGIDLSKFKALKIPEENIKRFCVEMLGRATENPAKAGYKNNKKSLPEASAKIPESKPVELAPVEPEEAVEEPKPINEKIVKFDPIKVIEEAPEIPMDELEKMCTPAAEEKKFDIKVNVIDIEIDAGNIASFIDSIGIKGKVHLKIEQ